MEFLIASFGTNGDVLPVIRLGALLRAKGHQVGLLAAPVFGDRARAAGLQFIPSADDTGYRAAVRDMPLLATRYRSLFIRRHAVDWNEKFLAAIAASRPAIPVILGVERPYLWADLYAHSRWKMPCLRFVLDPPRPRHWPAGSQLPGGRIQAALTSRIHHEWAGRLDQRGWQSGPGQIARLSRSVLPRVPRLGLWPSWLAARHSQTQVARSFGFVMDHAKMPRGRPADARPLLIFITGTTGTIGTWEAGYLGTCVEICRGLDCDGILLGATDEALRTPVPAWFRCERFLPLDRLLPNATAIVHHGGIGTSALALYHAIPQLIVPRVFGQPINAELLRRLGVCQVLEPSRFNAPQATALLRELIAHPSFRENAERISRQMQPAQDLINLAAFIEAHAQRQVSRPPAAPAGFP